MRDNVSQSVPQFVITNDDHYCNACSVYMHIIERSGNGIFHMFEDARMYGLRDPEIRIFGTPFHYSSHLKSVEPNPLGKPNAERFKSVLEGLIASSKVIEGQHFLSMKSIIGNANAEISMMKDEVLEYAYEKGVLPILSWLLSLVYWKDGSEQYVFIVNKETGDCFEPNYAMESFILYMLTSLGHESCVCKKIHKLLEEKGYNYFFERCKSTNDVFTA